MAGKTPAKGSAKKEAKHSLKEKRAQKKDKGAESVFKSRKGA